VRGRVEAIVDRPIDVLRKSLLFIVSLELQALPKLIKKRRN
jgi:hypothetical protein